MSYITDGTFWTITGILAVSIVVLWIRMNNKTNNKSGIASGDKRTYGLNISLNPSVVDEKPELKAIFNAYKKSSRELLSKGSSTNLLFLASDCRWFVQDHRNNHFIFPTFRQRSKVLFWKQILGKDIQESVTYSGKIASFVVTEWSSKEKDHFLSFDIITEDYGDGRISPKSKNRIHLGEFPIPKYYDEWTDADFDKIEQFGWKENRREFNWTELDDDFGNHENVLDPLEFENKDMVIRFLD